jgi:hypothetical protein
MTSYTSEGYSTRGSAYSDVSCLKASSVPYSKRPSSIPAQNQTIKKPSLRPAFLQTKVEVKEVPPAFNSLEKFLTPTADLEVTVRCNLMKLTQRLLRESPICSYKHD